MRTQRREGDTTKQEPLVGNTNGTRDRMKVLTKQQRIAELARNRRNEPLTCLHQHIDEDWMEEAYRQTRKDGATGVDGETAKSYEENLKQNLKSLLGRIKSGTYHAPPVRRTYIPKAGGKGQRALGIPTFEDKVAQRAIVMALEPIYEQEFKAFSFGYRKGCSAHGALQYLRNQIMDNSGRWILEVDISRYFDTINHQRLREFLDQRVTDGVIRRMIDKWLRAGVLEDGSLKRTETGTPQGGVISPLLANLYLHYVIDEWFTNQVTPRMQGRCSLTRFADDFVMVFEYDKDCKRVYKVLGKRLNKFDLSLHPEKTRVVDFRFGTRQGDNQKRLEAFDFLGFTHLWVKSRRGFYVVRQRTAKARLAKAIKSIEAYCKIYRHKALSEQHEKLCQMIRGHYQYFGITGNSESLEMLAYQAKRKWQKWISRRSHTGYINWEGFNQILDRYPLPKHKIYHRYYHSERTL